MPASPTTTTIRTASVGVLQQCRRRQATCSGQLNAVSFDVDWQFAKKFDLYAGFMYSAVANGLANGYLFMNNCAPTAGLRFRF